MGISSFFRGLFGSGGGGGDDRPARFDGLVWANVSSFNITEGRTIVSALFDNFQVAQRAAAADGEAKAEAQSRRMDIAFSPAARGGTARTVLRGFWDIASGSVTPRVTLRIAGLDHEAALAPDAGSRIELEVDTVLPADKDILGLVVEVEIPKPETPGTEAMITIDSIDVELLA